ncbi:MAG TPA: FHA domain-containing protein [Anaerolineae bacterium]
MDILLFTLRVLIALALYAFLGVLLWTLLREHRLSSTPHQSAALLRLDLSGEPIQSPGARYTLSARAPTWIGRDPNCAICVNSEFASAQHACVEWHTDQRAWWIKDNTSRNGITVNGERVMRSELADGDTIAVAGTQFRLTMDDGDSTL